MTDIELLDRYVRDKSEAAISELITRYTDLVYTACRHTLHDHHMAEDATQATFMILMKKAGGLNAHGGLGPWLFRTARYVAQNARRAIRSREAREEEAALMAQQPHHRDAATGAGAADVIRALDSALVSLPHRERDALLLHYYSGQTEVETAASLGCAQSTVSDRLRSGIERLRKRLASRGVVVSVVVLTSALAARGGEAAPAGLASSVSASCSGGVAAGGALAIVEATLSAMYWTRFKLVAGGLALIVALGLTAGLLLARKSEAPYGAQVTEAQEGQTRETQRPAPIDPRGGGNGTIGIRTDVSTPRLAGLGRMPRYEVNYTPQIPDYKIAPNLSNVTGIDALMYLPAHQKSLLAENGFLIRPTVELDFYQLYAQNPAPFVTTDSVFHAYHVILADTLKNMEKACLAEALTRLAEKAHDSMKRIYAEVPESLRAPAQAALTYYAVAAKLANPGTELHADVRDSVMEEIRRIDEARLVGQAGGRQRDYTVYKPIAGYESDEQLKRYFRTHRYLTLTPLPFDTAEGAQTVLLAARAVISSDDARSAYERMAGLTRFLAGAPEDPGPFAVMAAARTVFGPELSMRDLSDSGKAKALSAALVKLRMPQIADQPQVKPGSDPSPGRGMRLLCPGVTVRALAFQSLGEKEIVPTGEHLARVLGNEGVDVGAAAKLLTGAGQAMDERKRNFYEDIDLHSGALVVLSHLSGPWKQGFPQFMRASAWQLKTANTQMGAWSQLEHDLFLYAKDNSAYLNVEKEVKGFHGYVEPVPEYYASLASLVGQTRTAFETLDVFDKLKPSQNTRERAGRSRNGIVPTREHYEALEELLLRLKVMAEKELENRPFDEDEILLLATFGKKLKHLCFNDSSSAEPVEPMSSVVRIAREYLEEKGRYAGVGRPLEILAVVPWRGELYLTKGAVYSFYQFARPLRQPLTDTEWKNMTGRPLAMQAERPWLFGKGMGVDPVVWSAKDFKDWLPEEDEHLGSSFGGGRVPEAPDRSEACAVDSIGLVSVGPEVIPLLEEAFAKGNHYQGTRWVLYTLAGKLGAEDRARIAVSALRTIAHHTGPGGNRIDAMDYRLWTVLSLRLLAGVPKNAETVKAVNGIRQRLAEHEARKLEAYDPPNVLKQLHEMTEKYAKE